MGLFLELCASSAVVTRAIFKGWGFTGSKPPKCSLQKFSTLLQHISAVAVVNTVTILSRSIAFSFHLEYSVTIKKCRKGIFAAPRTQLGELTMLLRPPS